jgi:hypothetical protein
MITIAIIIVAMIILLLISRIIKANISLKEKKELINNLERFKEEWKNKYTNNEEK